jgi:hypothetical protein
VQLKSVDKRRAQTGGCGLADWRKNIFKRNIIILILAYFSSLPGVDIHSE